MLLVTISPIEWVIIGLGALIIIFYITYSIYRKKHPKQKKNDEVEE